METRNEPKIVIEIDDRRFVEGEDFAVDRLKLTLFLLRDSDLGRAGSTVKLRDPVDFSQQPFKQKT